jgi:phosphatidylserine decarboxylase
MRNQLKIYYHHLLPKRFLTFIAFILANSKIKWLKNYLIADFIKKHPVNMQEAAEPNPFAYASFNDFFTRNLAPNARTFAHQRYISPVDGAISEAGKLQQDQLLQAKGMYYRLGDLIAEPNAANYADFIDGSFMTIYLSPSDYHRVHMPIKGQLVKQTYIPGNLYSVQPFTTEHIPHIFSENERLVLHFTTEDGPFIMILVGATIVGCIGTSWQGDLKRQNQLQTQEWENGPILEKGAETGYFKLGSTVILVWPKFTNVQWTNPWRSGTNVRLGEAIAD